MPEQYEFPFPQTWELEAPEDPTESQWWGMEGAITPTDSQPGMVDDVPFALPADALQRITEMRGEEWQGGESIQPIGLPPQSMLMHDYDTPDAAATQSYLNKMQEDLSLLSNWDLIKQGIATRWDATKRPAFERLQKGFKEGNLIQKLGAVGHTLLHSVGTAFHVCLIAPGMLVGQQYGYMLLGSDNGPYDLEPMLNPVMRALIYEEGVTAETVAALDASRTAHVEAYDERMETASLEIGKRKDATHWTQPGSSAAFAGIGDYIAFLMESSRRKAARKVGEDERTWRHRLEAFSRGGSPLAGTYSEELQRHLARGFRWTHLLDTDRAMEYEQYVLDGGMAPEDAGNITSDLALEIVGNLIMIEPIEALTPINAINRIPFKMLGKPMGWIGKKAIKRFGDNWLLSESIRSLGAKRTAAAREVVSMFKGAVPDLTPPQCVGYLKRLGPALEAAGKQFPTEKLLLDNWQEVVELLAKDFPPELVENLSRPRLVMLARVVKISPDLFDSVLAKNMNDLDGFVLALQGKVFKNALKQMAEEMPEIGKVWKKLQDHRWMRTIGKMRGFLVELWLGRPSYHLFNKYDNSLRLLVNGVGPFGKGSHINNLYRYAEYALDANAAKDFAKYSEDLGLLTDLKALLQGKPEHFAEYVRRADTMFAQGVTGSLGRGSLERAQEAGGWSLTRGPEWWRKTVGDKLKAFGTMSGKIESIPRQRLFIHLFLDNLENAWDAEFARITAEGAEELASPAALRHFIQGIQDLPGKTPRAIRELFEQYTKETGLTQRRIAGLLFEETLEPSFPDELGRTIRQALDLEAGKGHISDANLDEIFGEAQRRVGAERQTKIVAGRARYAKNLPVVPPTPKEFAQDLFEGVTAPNDVFVRLKDMKAYYLKFKHSADTINDVMHVQWAEEGTIARAASGRTQARLLAETSTSQKTFFESTQPGMWQGWIDKQNAAFDEAASLLKKFGVDISDDIFDEAKDAVEALHGVNRRKFKEWGYLYDEIDGMPFSTEREAIFQRKKGIIRSTYETEAIGATTRTSEAIAGVEQHLASRGVFALAPEETHALSHLIQPGWDVEIANYNNVPAEVGREIDLWSDTLRAWKKAVDVTRLARTAEEVITEDLSPLAAFAKRMQTFARNTASEAEDLAMTQTNQVMLDYTTTENWMEVLGALFPFVRFRVKNIPSWVSMMSEHPRWAVNATRLRRYQAVANQDLPARLRYSIRLTGKDGLPDTVFFKLMGLNNTHLYWNPWQTLSIYQAIPGGTPFKSRQLMDMTGTDDNSLGALWQLGQQFGIGMWPIPEFMLGTLGMLGNDWIFRDALGTWSPMVKWLAVELGAEPTWNPEAFLRHQALQMWNKTFSNFPALQRPYENPEMMTKWLMGRLTEQEIFELTDEQLAMGWTPDQVKMYQEAVRQQMVTTLIGHTTAFYLQPVTEAEVANTLARRLKRAEQQAVGPGEEYREIGKKWYEDDPRRALVQHHRFGEYPWATQAGGALAEVVDGRVDWYTSMYWDNIEKLETAHAQEIQFLFLHAPGIFRLEWESDTRYREAKNAMREKLEADLNIEVQDMFDRFKQENPGDPATKKLEEGFEMDIYYTPHLAPEVVARLQEYRKLHPEDKEGYLMMAQAELERAKGEQGTTKSKVLSLNKGLEINLGWSEHGRTPEEIRRKQADDLLWELHAKRPTYMDYEGDYDAYATAKSEYFAGLDELAMETEQASAQVSRLVDSGFSQKEATEVIRGLYSYERIEQMWRSGDTIAEAVNSVYRTAFMDKAYQYRDETLYGKEYEGPENMELRQLMWAEFTAHFQERPADDLISHVLAEYPGRWTAWELTERLEGVMMPSFEDYDRLNAVGKKAIIKNIRYYYHRLPDSQKWRLDQALGSQFAQELIQSNEGYSFTYDQLGEWLAAVSLTATGQELDYLKLPGVFDSAESTMEKIEAGLTPVRSEHEAEFEQYEALNKAYWESRVAGTAQWELIEQNPIWKKYSRQSGTQAYFWYQYKESIPPGWVSYEFRHHPGIAVIRHQSRDPYLSTATIKEYEDGIQLIEGFLQDEELQLLIAENGLDNKAEWPRVEELMNIYYDIPQENKDARKAFLEANPLLKKYLKKPKVAKAPTTAKAAKAKKAATGKGGLTYGRGAARISAPRVNYTQVWSTFQRTLGASMMQVVQQLVPYWNGEDLSAGMEKYLRNLYARIGGDIGFKKWLEALRLAYLRVAAQAPKVGKPKAAPRAYYGQSAGMEALRGRRRE